MATNRATCRAATTTAGILFIAATLGTSISQILLEPILEATNPLQVLAARRNTWVIGSLLEFVNGLSSAGIAIALYPVLRRVSEAMAVAYLGLRLIEGTTGIVGGIAFLMLLSAGARSFAAAAFALHDWAFLTVLLVFCISTLVLYSTLFRYRLVPRWLSAWGFLGGVSLLVSVMLILFGRTTMGSGLDVALSSLIFAQEMVLALWLIFRGVEMPDPDPSRNG